MGEKRAPSALELRRDYIVVGAGSAGCAVASRLSEDPATSVLLLEAGGGDWSPVVLAPAATDLHALGRPAFDWCYSAEPDPSRKDRSDFWPRGKIIGGSSSINGTIYMRGHRNDYDAWAERGADGWDFQQVLPYFRRAETNDLGESEYHGVHGPLSVEGPRYVHPLTETFVQAACQSGLRFNPDLNGSVQDGVGFNQATQRRGWRCSSARAYLRPNRRRANLAIVTHAHVTRILFEGTQAVGVEYRRSNELHHVYADREVVVSAGAIGSPQLLMLSGVGPVAQLQAHGIKAIIDSPEVGSNLQEHPGAWLTYQTTRPTLNNETAIHRQIWHGLNWLLRGRGPATTAGAQAVAFLRTEAQQSQPDIQLHFMPVGYRFHPTHVELYREPTVSVLVNVCRPLSRGTISLRSARSEDAPVIRMPLLAHQDDLRVLTAGCRRARAIMAAPIISSVLVAERAPGIDAMSDAEWESYLRASAVPCYHPVGTCRMGSDLGAVVDARLRVRGIAGLRVVDASVIPIIPSGNTNAAAIMIGEKAADLIKSDYAH